MDFFPPTRDCQTCHLYGEQPESAFEPSVSQESPATIAVRSVGEHDVLESGRLLSVYPPGTLDDGAAQDLARAALWGESSDVSRRSFPDIAEWQKGQQDTKQMLDLQQRAFTIDVFDAASASAQANRMTVLGLGIHLSEALDIASPGYRAGALLLPDAAGLAARTARLSHLFANQVPGGDLEVAAKAIDLAASLGQEGLAASASASTWKRLQALDTPYPVRLTGLSVLPDATPDIWLSGTTQNPRHALPPPVLDALRSPDPQALDRLPAQQQRWPAGLQVDFQWDLGGRN